MTEQICIRCQSPMEPSDSFSVCSTCQARDAEILAREDRVNFMLTVDAAWKASGVPMTTESDDADEIEDADEPSLEWQTGPDVPCETCETIKRDNPPVSIDVSWMHTTMSADEADQMLAALNAHIADTFGVSDDDDGDNDTLFEDTIDDFMANAVEERHILTRDPETGEITTEDESQADDEPSVLVGEPAKEIPCETCGKLFWSLDSDHTECRDCDEAAAAVMFLTFDEARFMERVCLFDGLLVYPHQVYPRGWAKRLEEGKLVTIDRSHAEYWVVSAVRPSRGED